MEFLDKLADFFGFNNEDSKYKYENFGDLLKRVRLSREMTSSELSDKAGISQSYISQLENNVRLPSDNIIKKISYGLIEKNNPKADFELFNFGNDEEKQGYDNLVSHFIEARNYMRIKDIPTMIEPDSTDGLLQISEREKRFLELFNEMPKKEQENLLDYMKFLINKKWGDYMQQKEKYNLWNQVNNLINILALVFAPYGIYSIFKEEMNTVEFIMWLLSTVLLTSIYIYTRKKLYIKPLKKIIFKNDTFENFLKK